MKFLIALNNSDGMYSKLSQHFGHCLYFGVFDTETKDLSFINNSLDHSNTTITPVDQIMQFNPDAIFSLGIGKRALNLFAEKGVKVKSGDFTILQEVIDNIDNLKDLSQGCK